LPPKKNLKFRRRASFAGTLVRRNFSIGGKNCGGESEGEADNSIWWTILKLARTFFAPRFARGGGEAQKI